MSPPREHAAEHLRPDDLLRRGDALYVALTVSVSTDLVEIAAIRIIDGQATGTEILRFSPAEITRVLTRLPPEIAALAGMPARDSAAWPWPVRP